MGNTHKTNGENVSVNTQCDNTGHYGLHLYDILIYHLLAWLEEGNCYDLNIHHLSIAELISPMLFCIQFDILVKMLRY